MAKSKPLSLKFPAGGVSKRFGYHKQPPYTTPSANNVWPTQWETGRARGGTRPGLTQADSVTGFGTAYNWCECTWENSQTSFVGVAVVTSSGTWVSTSIGTWNERVTTAPGSTFCSCAVYQQKLYQASTGTSKTRVYDLVLGGSDTGHDATAEKGTAPAGCGLVLAWGDRLVLAGDEDDPHIIYMSRVGDANDWDYSAVDTGAAWANSGGSAGKIGEPITSLIPHNRDCLLVGGTDSLYAIRGNPRAGGQIYTLSHKVGPLMQSAWCKTSNDFTFMMTRDGLYQMRPGCGEPPLSVSRERLPDDLVAIDPGAGDTVSLAYDSRFRGVHIYVNYSDSSTAYYFYDLAGEGFWPMTLATDVDLAFEFKKESSSTKSALAVAQGTSISQYDTANTTEAISSSLWYGPIALGNPHQDGVMTELTAVLAEDSDDVAWSVYVGDSPQQAFNGSAIFTGAAWDIQGRNYTQNPRASGVAAYLKVEETATTDRWSIEEIVGTATLGGRARVG